MKAGRALKDHANQLKLSILGGFLLSMAFHSWILITYFQVDRATAAWDSFVFNSLALGSVLLMTMLVPRLPKAGEFQVVISISALLSVTAYWVGAQVVDQLVALPEYVVFLQAGAPLRCIMLFLVTGGAGLSMIFYNRWREVVEAKSLETDTNVMVKEAELQKLQTQLQPHFLFNSLNSINALIMIEPDRARQMVQQLSDFLRTTLARADERWITLNQELEYLQLYLSIERVRFGHRLDVQIEMDEQIKLWLIPPLLIQPLVENAIKFGLYGTTDEVVIKMTTRRIDNSLQLEISNPFDTDMQPPSGSGFGLSGIRRRLYLLYARNDLLQTAIQQNVFTVQLTLPEKL